MKEPDELLPVSPGQPAVLSRQGPVDDFAARAEPILLDVPLTTVVLDVLGVLALFATVAALSGVRDGAVATSAIGVYVLAARMLRTRRARLADSLSGGRRRR